MFEHVGMPLLRWQASGFRARSKDAEELCAIEPATLLAGEEVIAAVLFAFAEPGSQRIHFVKERLPSVLIEWLHLAKGALEPTHSESAIFEVRID